MLIVVKRKDIKIELSGVDDIKNATQLEECIEDITAFLCENKEYLLEAVNTLKGFNTGLYDTDKSIVFNL